MDASPYDEKVQFYLDFVDRALSQENSPFVRLLEIEQRMLGAKLEGARVLDLACGEGNGSRHFARAGAREVVGVDIATALIEEARRRTDDPKITYVVDDGHTLATQDAGSFDVVVSQMAMMDIPDHRATFASVHRVLDANGAFVFAMLHPCFEVPFKLPELEPWLTDDGGAPTAVIVRDYATEGFWTSGSAGVRGQMGSHHRMLSTYLNDLIAAGFLLRGFEEPTFEGTGLFERVPRFIVVTAAKARDRSER